MSQQQFEEKYEKKDEKDEKEYSKHEEKSGDEKWRRDPLSAVTWAAIFIWAGVVFLVNNMGLLGRLPLWQFLPQRGGAHYQPAWPIVLIGAGCILIIEVVLRALMPIYRRPLRGTVFLAAILIGSGLGFFFGWNLVWPVILDDYIKNRDVWRCPSAKVENGAAFIIGIGLPDYLERWKSTEGMWGRNADDLSGPCSIAWPNGWGGVVTDSIEQRRIAAQGAWQESGDALKCFVERTRTKTL